MNLRELNDDRRQIEIESTGPSMLTSHTGGTYCRCFRIRNSRRLSPPHIHSDRSDSYQSFFFFYVSDPTFLLQSLYSVSLSHHFTLWCPSEETFSQNKHFTSFEEVLNHLQDKLVYNIKCKVSLLLFYYLDMV